MVERQGWKDENHCYTAPGTCCLPPVLGEHQRSKSGKRNRGMESGTCKEKAKRMTAALSPPPDPSSEGDVSFRYPMRVGMGGLQHMAFLNSDATGNSPLWETVVHWEPHMHRPINTSVGNIWNLPHGPEILCVRNISIFFHNLIFYLSDSTCTLLSKVNCFIYFPSEPDLKLYLNLIGLTKSAGKFFHSFLSREIGTYTILMHFHLFIYLCERLSLWFVPCK